MIVEDRADLQKTTVSNDDDDDESQHMTNLAENDIEIHHREFHITSLIEFMNRMSDHVKMEEYGAMIL
jgi:hypothetical protein